MTVGIWSSEEVATLKAEYGKCLAKDIAAKLGRTTKSVIGKAYKLGLTVPTGFMPKMKAHWKNNPWLVDGMEARLREMWCTEMSVDDIAKRLRVTQTSARKRAAKLGLKRPKQVPAKQQYIQPKPLLVIVKPIPIPAHITGVPLSERTGCCFPINDGGPFLFCNEPGQSRTSHGSKYCDYHWHVMHEKAAQHHPEYVRRAGRGVAA